MLNMVCTLIRLDNGCKFGSHLLVSACLRQRRLPCGVTILIECSTFSRITRFPGWLATQKESVRGGGLGLNLELRPLRDLSMRRY